MNTGQPFLISRTEVKAVDCPCGQSTRLITRTQSPDLGLHVTRFCRGDRHLHERTTEAYYILEGEGFVELGEESYAVTPGQAILIPPGVPHRGWGDFTAVVVSHPAFDPEDEIVLPG